MVARAEKDLPHSTLKSEWPGPRESKFTWYTPRPSADVWTDDFSNMVSVMHGAGPTNRKPSRTACRWAIRTKSRRRKSWRRTRKRRDEAQRAFLMSWPGQNNVMPRSAGRPGHRIGARRARVFGLDFRHRVGERQDQGPLRHGLHHGLGHQARRRQSEEDVGTLDRLGECALGSVQSVARLVGIHELGPTGVDHPRDVDHQEILLAQTERGQQIQAGERRRAGAARREPHLLDALAQGGAAR